MTSNLKPRVMSQQPRPAPNQAPKLKDAVTRVLKKVASLQSDTSTPNKRHDKVRLSPYQARDKTSKHLEKEQFNAGKALMT